MRSQPALLKDQSQQATVAYPMPNDPGELGEASHVDTDSEGHDSNDDGELSEAV